MSGTTAPARGEFEVEETQTLDHLGAIDPWLLGSSSTIARPVSMT
jgi:hypothetical protein